MKLQDLFERDSFKDFDDVFDYIINTSRPALSQLPTPLYRGMWDVDQHDKLISSGKRFKSDDDLHLGSTYIEMYDRWMVEHFNYKYLSGGIFTTGMRQISEEYGELFIILPIGKFSYVWSPIVEDQIEISHGIEDTKGYTYEQFSKLMESKQYTNRNITRALRTGHEIILNVDRYFHLSLRNVKEWGGNYTSLEKLWDDLRG